MIVRIGSWVASYLDEEKEEVDRLVLVVSVVSGVGGLLPIEQDQ